MSSEAPCIGCGRDIADKPYVIDDNGEIGCPACFDDARQDECWAHDRDVERVARAICEAAILVAYPDASPTVLATLVEHFSPKCMPEARAAIAALAASKPEAEKPSALADEHFNDQQRRREELAKRILMFADLLCDNPLPGEDGDIAYELLREAAARISSDKQLLAKLAALRTSPNAEQPSERERIVAWLRTPEAEQLACRYINEDVPKAFAVAIERGDHLESAQ